MISLIFSTVSRLLHNLINVSICSSVSCFLAYLQQSRNFAMNSSSLIGFSTHPIASSHRSVNVLPSFRYNVTMALELRACAHNSGLDSHSILWASSITFLSFSPSPIDVIRIFCRTVMPRSTRQNKIRHYELMLRLSVLRYRVRTK